MVWFKKHMNLMKFILATLLILFMIFGFVEYFIGNKVLDSSIRGQKINFTGEIHTGILVATLVFSLISLISVFVILSLGSHEKTLVAMITLIAGLVLLIILFALVVASMHNLSEVNKTVVVIPAPKK